MSDLNRCEFIGRLGADPEVRAMPSGKQVANIRIAVSQKWKDQGGERQEKTEWIPITFFEPLAKIVEQYVHKGDQIYVSGRFQTRKWQDKDGNDRYATDIIAQDLQMLGSKRDQASRDQPGDANAARTGQSGGYDMKAAETREAERQRDAQAGRKTVTADFDDDDPDSIPF